MPRVGTRVSRELKLQSMCLTFASALAFVTVRSTFSLCQERQLDILASKQELQQASFACLGCLLVYIVVCFCASQTYLCIAACGSLCHERKFAMYCCCRQELAGPSAAQSHSSAGIQHVQQLLTAVSNGSLTDGGGAPQSPGAAQS